MNTELMLHLKKFSAEDFGKMRTQFSQMKEVIDGLNEIAQISMSRNQLQYLLEQYYDLGELVEAYEIFGGYVNRSFGIIVEKNGVRSDYFVRKYKRGITDRDISLEHKLVTFAKQNGMDTAAGVIPALDGSTFIRMDEEKEGKIVNRAFAIYDFLEGEDKYTWIDTNLLPEEDASFAKLLAQFHNSARNFDPGDLVKEEPKIMDFLLELPDKFTKYVNQDIQGDIVHDLWKSSLDDIKEMCKVSFENLNKKELLDDMPYCYCHCDIHPGNVKWIDNQAVGMFDFDWSKLDLRLFDIAFALVYTCSSWEPQTDGRLWFERCVYFLSGYNEFLKGKNGLAPFTEAEKKAFPDMMVAATIYLLNWNSTYYEAIDECNTFEYFFYLVHTLRVMHYIDQHRDDLSELMKLL